MNENSAVTTLVAVGLLVAAVAVLLWSNGMIGGPPKAEAYFYDVKTQQLFTAPSEKLGPIDAPSGAGNGMTAHVYSCSSCSSNRFVAWIEKFSAKGKHKKTNSMIPKFHGDEDMVRKPDGTAWVPVDSLEGKKITDTRNLCKTGTLTDPCFPD